MILQITLDGITQEYKTGDTINVIVENKAKFYNKVYNKVFYISHFGEKIFLTLKIITQKNKHRRFVIENKKIYNYETKICICKMVLIEKTIPWNEV